MRGSVVSASTLAGTTQNRACLPVPARTSQTAPTPSAGHTHVCTYAHARTPQCQPGGTGPRTHEPPQTLMGGRRSWRWLCSRVMPAWVVLRACGKGLGMCAFSHLEFCVASMLLSGKLQATAAPAAAASPAPAPRLPAAAAAGGGSSRGLRPHLLASRPSSGSSPLTLTRAQQPEYDYGGGSSSSTASTSYGYAEDTAPGEFGEASGNSSSALWWLKMWTEHACSHAKLAQESWRGWAVCASADACTRARTHARTHACLPADQPHAAAPHTHRAHAPGLGTKSALGCMPHPLTPPCCCSPPHSPRPRPDAGRQLQEWLTNPFDLLSFGPRAGLGALLSLPERISSL